jgi:flagellar basal-body rod protein FlgG
MPNSTAYMIDLARSGILARMFDLDNVSHNIANSNTTAFKSARVNFQEILNQALDGSDMKSGVRAAATQRLMGQGALRNTNLPLDVAIQGEGFFAVTLADGRTAYTRDGSFTRDANSRLVTANGDRLVWTGQIPAAAEEIHINPDGAVMTRQGTTWTQAGANFVSNP